MSQAISTEHPAVVLRSRSQQLRALLAVALVAVVALAAAVVILALNDDPDAVATGLVPVNTPSATGHDESVTAAAIGSAFGHSTRSGGPDESVVADAISGR